MKAYDQWVTGVCFWFLSVSMVPAGYFQRRTGCWSVSPGATYARRYKERLKSNPGAYRQYQLKCRDAMRRLRERRRLDRLVSQSLETTWTQQGEGRQTLVSRDHTDATGRVGADLSAETTTLTPQREKEQTPSGRAHYDSTEKAHTDFCL